MATTLAQREEPIVVHTRLFKGDDGWYYELKIWKGDVDTNSVDPTIVVSKKPYRVKRSAAQVLVHEFARVIGVRLPGI